MEISRLSTCLLTAILIVGAILRFNHITQPLIDAFSWRETDTAMMAENYYSTNWNILRTKLNWDGPGPGYQGREFQTLSYLAALLYLLVGQHDWVGRAVAVLFGCGASSPFINSLSCMGRTARTCQRRSYGVAARQYFY